MVHETSTMVAAQQRANETRNRNVRYRPDIKIEAYKILLCATFIAIGQRVSIRYAFFLVSITATTAATAAAADMCTLLFHRTMIPSSRCMLLDMNRAPFGPFHLLLCGKWNGHKTNFVFTIHRNRLYAYTCVSSASRFSHTHTHVYRFIESGGGWQIGWLLSMDRNDTKREKIRFHCERLVAHYIH